MTGYCEDVKCYELKPCSKHQNLRLLMDERSSSWEYVNEGAVNMVFRYVSNHSELHLRAIRLSKNLLSNPLSSEEANVVRVSHEYTKHVISRLLGEEYVDAGEVMWVSVSAALALVLACTPQRLSSRLRVHPLEQMQTACANALDAKIPVLLMMDMAHLPEGGLPDRPTFSLEIKPKWGFLPHSPFIDEEHSVKRHVCRYCMMQLHKAKEADGGVPSCFCPLDIYSGNKARVCRAICHLIKNPQNNFRVAWQSPKDAQMHQALPAQSPEALEEALRVLFSKPEAAASELLGPFVELVASLILNPFTSRLMRRLQQTQIDFDMFDIEGTRHLYELLLTRTSNPSTDEAVQWARRAVQVYSDAGKLDRELWRPRRRSAHRHFPPSTSRPFSLHYATFSSSSTSFNSLSKSDHSSSSSSSSSSLAATPHSSSLDLLSSPVCNNHQWLPSMSAHACLEPHEDKLWQAHADTDYREMHNEHVCRIPSKLDHHARLSSVLQSRKHANRRERSGDGSNGSSSSMNQNGGLDRDEHNNDNTCNEPIEETGLASPTSWSERIHDDLVLAIAEFLISSTVKDLSLMFTFQLQQTPEEESKILWRMCAIDLDPKNPQKIPHHHSLDRNIVRHYLECCKVTR